MTLHLSAEELLARQKRQQYEWRQANPEKVRAYYRKHNQTEKSIERRKTWAVENKERCNARRRELYRMRNPLPAEPEVAPPELSEEEKRDARNAHRRELYRLRQERARAATTT